MKKILLTVTVVIVALFAFGYFFGKMSSGTWQEYSNSRYNFTVDYPPRWSLGQAPTNNDGREFLSPENIISCRAYGFQNALAGANGQNQTLSEFIEWLIDTQGTIVISSADQKLGKISGKHLVTKQENTIQSAVYTLSPETGYGVICVYQSEKDYKKHQKDFQHMVKSFGIGTDAEDYRGNAEISCENYLSNVIASLQDLETFIDTKYTEVTLTSRDAWDRSRLPSKVIDLEGIDYTCYPMPFEMSDTGQLPNVNAQPEVTSVEWTCELDYVNYKYVDSTKVDQKDSLESDGYYCEKQACFLEDNRDSYVWMCAQIK